MAIDAPRPAIHMLLQIDVPEGPYLADVGFGNLAPTSALLLKSGIEQETPHEPMRFIDIGGELTLQSRLRDTSEHIYRALDGQKIELPKPRHAASSSTFSPTLCDEIGRERQESPKTHSHQLNAVRQ